MPELPEVETIKNVLKHNLLNKTIESIDLTYAPLLEEDSDFKIDKLINQTFRDFKRRGKFLIFEFDGVFWVVHLRMEGKFHLYDAPTKPTKHTHLTFKADNQYVHYLDTRKFSRMAVVSDLDAYLKSKNLGYEPWDKDLTAAFLHDR